MGESPAVLDRLGVGALRKLLVSALREIETPREEDAQLRDQVSRLRLQEESRSEYGYLASRIAAEFDKMHRRVGAEHDSDDTVWRVAKMIPQEAPHSAIP